MTLFGKKPGTLCEVVRRVKAGEQKFDPSLREFLDVFYTQPATRKAALEDRPDSIDAVHDAYVAAVAEHLARSFGLAIPQWTETHGNDLHEPFFAGGASVTKGCSGCGKSHRFPTPTAVRQQRCSIETEASAVVVGRCSTPERSNEDYGSSSVSQYQ